MQFAFAFINDDRTNAVPRHAAQQTDGLIKKEVSVMRLTLNLC